MSRVSFDSTKKPLEDLLKQAHTGVLQLPDFQRSWVWKDDGLRALLASVSRSFPVGTLMTLQTGGEVDFKPRLIEGAPEPSRPVKPDALLLDGQQRITSLYQLTMQQGVVATRDAKKQPVRRWYYFDMAKALDPDVDRLDAIFALREDFTEVRDLKIVRSAPDAAAEYEQMVFPTNRIFSSDEWMMGFFNHWQFAPEKTQFWLRFKNEVIAAFQQYQMPVIELEKSTSREAVCLVFEKVNTGGEKLDAFELLTATYAAYSFDLRADWRGGGEAGEGRAKRLRQAIAFNKNVLTELQPTDFLQAVSLLHTLEQRRKSPGSDFRVTGTREALLRIPLDRYKALAPRIEQGFAAAARLLFGQRVYALRDLPYQSQLIPLAVVMADVGEGKLTQDARAKLIRWWWCGVFGELYGSATDSRFARDVLELPEWIAGAGPEPLTVQEAIFRADRLDRMTFRISAAYKGVSVLLMQIGARDFRTGQGFDHATYFGEGVDIHHIFPRKWCQDHRIAPLRTDSIVNKTPLFYKSNRTIGGAAPSVYLARLARDVGGDAVLDEILRSHLIAPDRLRADDFDGFYAARRAALLGAIEQAMGKAAYLAESGEPAPEQDDDDIEQEDEITEDAAALDVASAA